MPIRFIFFLLFCLSFHALAQAEPLDQVGRAVDYSQIAGPEVRFKINLAGAKDNVKIAQLKDGTVVYLVKRLGSGTDRMLTAEEFTQFYYTQQSSKGWLFTLLNVTSAGGVGWVIFGLGAQAVFMGRFLIQWFASEKTGRSVVPVSFWWMSLIGGTMSLLYFVWRRDIVGILGQATGWIVYIRNLALIYRAKKANP